MRLKGLIARQDTYIEPIHKSVQLQYTEKLNISVAKNFSRQILSVYIPGRIGYGKPELEKGEEKES